MDKIIDFRKRHVQYCILVGYTDGEPSSVKAINDNGVITVYIKSDNIDEIPDLIEQGKKKARAKT